MNEVLTFISHFIAGVITAISTLVSPVLAVILFLTFIIYEVDEDYHLSDRAFRDIREFAYGLFATTIVIIAIEVG